MSTILPRRSVFLKAARLLSEGQQDPEAGVPHYSARRALCQANGTWEAEDECLCFDSPEHKLFAAKFAPSWGRRIAGWLLCFWPDEGYIGRRVSALLQCAGSQEVVNDVAL